MSERRKPIPAVTLREEYRDHHIYVSDEGTYDPAWDTRTIYHSITTPDGAVVMDSFCGDTGDTCETYLAIMKRHVDWSFWESNYWGGE